MLLPTWFCFFLFQFCASAASAVAPTSSLTDTLNPTESITDGQIVVSNGGNFALGFFSPGISSYRYVGIWYHKIPETTVVWVANRDNPVNDSSGVLSLDGNLVVSSRSDQRRPLWSTNVSISSDTTVLKLLNTGNLVLYSGGEGNRILWQSFDHPTHMWLPGMKLGLDRKTGLNRVLTSWKSKDDPGRGIYSYGFDPRGFPEMFLYKGSATILRSGSWNGRVLSGVPEMTRAYLFSYAFVNTTDELYMIYDINNPSIFSTFVLNDSGTVQRMTWVDKNRLWNIFYTAPRDNCDDYGHCGDYGGCSSDNPVECSCLPGFQPKSPRDWYLREWSDGCVRKRRLGCGKGDGFLKLVGVKPPDTTMSLVDMNLSLKECEQECLNNCSCFAYAPADITGGGGGSGCVTWFGNLMDIRYFSDGGQDFYLRVDAVELAAQARKDKGILHSKGRVMILTLSLVVVLLLFAASVYLFLKKRKGATEKRRRRSGFLIDFRTSSKSYKNSPATYELEDNGTNPDLPFIEVDVVAAATDNFSPINKLGQGGFGAVYKGRLFNGKEIAVKRLSRNSGQGMEEFKTEVLLIAKLQHRNLVRLLAYNAQEEEKMLIYEYMPNKSLDFFIFDKSKRALLDWRKRFEIIVGIARGVLYLHQDSRLRIIHRDLKASNVLLDEEMNPKISDFGMARIFGGNQSQANTTKVVGT
ncbi:G-type lectin S-receptor-like serine/threonine-protein kinase RKS1 [Macadamia integrifolia]|uniref:G-type lectin S-receptor-like serine/threonine-protein kinase RKS1 n=1 Tax=Macadamia integrifolia TaxID=60698 RepID=UPI001C4FCFF4|nr:G-type lectin S-receptor-like serine/threonine-protein kinase RKS1 [Macadamia integrifolia]